MNTQREQKKRGKENREWNEREREYIKEYQYTEGTEENR